MRAGDRGGHFCFVVFIKVTGIEGNFRMTCHNVMRVLRENKDSVMAVLEAFVYDPLLNWRLVDGLIFVTNANVSLSHRCLA